MNDYLQSLLGRVDRRHVARATISIVGAGRVGAQVAFELARLVPKRLIIVDGDDYEMANRSGHPLPAEFVGWNKAVAMAEFLQREIPGIENVTAVPHFIEAQTPDEQLMSEVIRPATLLIVATDDLAIQRHVSILARAVEVPAIVPGIAEDGSRGEAFLSLTENEPCLACFDGYRPAGSRVRAASVVAPDGLPAIHLAFRLALAVLDSDSTEAAELLTPLRDGGPVPQLFRAWPPGATELSHADDGRTEVMWRNNCPGCGGPRVSEVPSRPRPSAAAPAPATPPPMPVPPPGWFTPGRAAWGYVALLGLLVITGATTLAIYSVMLISLSVGLGIWAGFVWWRQP